MSYFKEIQQHNYFIMQSSKTSKYDWKSKLNSNLRKHGANFYKCNRLIKTEGVCQGLWSGHSLSSSTVKPFFAIYKVRTV